MNKKGFTSSLRAIILLLITFVVLALLFPIIFQGINKNKGYEGCRTQITMAAKEKPIAFDACHEYHLVFGEKSAVKYDLFDNNKKVDEYNYASLLKKYEFNYGVKFSDNQKLEYATYLVLAEEFKLNDYIYYAPNISIKRLGTKYAGTVCKPASLITFEQNIFQGEKYAGFSGFLNKTIYDLDSKNQLTYQEYLTERYESDLKKATSKLVVDDKHVKTLGSAATSLGFLILGVAGGPVGLGITAVYFTALIVSAFETSNIHGPDSYNLEIDTTQTYDLVFVYYSASTNQDYLNPIFISLLRYDEEPLACSGYLGVG